ncbi:MAG: UpxY family transcription antiterminator [[Clostridium] fimetarium]|nr:UpxY family transcription antiterminator [Alistipes timonensis]MCM1405587.1 UpxY family transcription antiterminator [[Clostridium] fimetarium]
MSENKDITDRRATVPQGVDGAVGVPGAKWFIAIVNNRSEKAAAERLAKMSVENYVPTQRVVKIWRNGKKAKVDRVVIPAVIFIHCTEEERKELVALPFIYRFMVNKAAPATPLGKPLAVVSDDEISRLKFMLGQSDVPVTITERPYMVGDRVRVIRGSLAGLEGEVCNADTAKSDVVVTLEHFGCARLQINTVNLEIIKGGKTTSRRKIAPVNNSVN